jgi:phosphoadenosine phosphosulfate reductase
MTIQTPLPGTLAPADTGDIYRNGRFEPDEWLRVPDDAPIPHGGSSLLSVKRFLTAVEQGSLGNGLVGVVVEPADRIADLVPHLDRLSVVAIAFPKFSDGRGFSHAALLARHGFTGEIRAIGNVLIDQVDYMGRLGFTAFEVRHGVTRRYLAEGKNPSPRLYYQPAVITEPPAGTRPWLRQSRDR